MNLRLKHEPFKDDEIAQKRNFRVGIHWINRIPNIKDGTKYEEDNLESNSVELTTDHSQLISYIDVDWALLRIPPNLSNPFSKEYNRFLSISQM